VTNVKCGGLAGGEGKKGGCGVVIGERLDAVGMGKVSRGARVGGRVLVDVGVRFFCMLVRVSKMRLKLRCVRKDSCGWYMRLLRCI
jgi:hypothetical protein